MPSLVTPAETTMQCQGKAPPIDPFTGENSEIRFEDWLPTLERAAAWNNWMGDELTIQLAGHLRVRALQEWNLLSTADCTTYQSAVVALRTHLDPENKTLAALDFRHIVQKETKIVSGFIRRLERTFQIAFGRDPMSTETKNVLLYGKLQDGLRIDLVSKAPAISGAQNYQELCMAARNEEKRLAELKRKRQYAQGTSGQFQPDRSQQQPSVIKKEDQGGKVISRRQVKCYTCGSPNHLACDCRVPTTESRGKTRMVKTNTECDKLNDFSKIAEYLFPSSISLPASMSVIQSEVITPKCIAVQIEGVPIRGIVDTGSDITILNGSAFWEIVNMSKVPNREQFKPANRKAYTYGHHPLSLDGQIDLHIKFGEKCICETVYN